MAKKSQQASPSPTRLPSKREKPKAEATLFDKLRTPLGMFTVVTALCVLGVVLTLLDSEGDRRNYRLEDYIREQDIVSRVNVVCDDAAKNSEYGCYVTAKAPMNRGDVAINVPKDAIIDFRAIANDEILSPFGANNGSVVQQYFEENNIGSGFVQLFTVAYYVAHHRRNPKSHLSGFFDALPTLSQMQGGLTWDPVYDQCIDRGALNEVNYLRALVNASVHISKQVCADNLHDCPPGGAFTEDEMKWAINVYLQFSLHDQAIVVPLAFAKHHQDKASLFPEWNKDTESLEIHVGAPTKKGDELFINSNRHVSAIITAYGRFDTSARGFPGSINADVRRVPLLKKYGCERSYHMVYGMSGRPQKELVTCVSILVASEEQRARFKRYENDPEVLMYTYGNLSGVIDQILESFQHTTEIEECKRDTPIAKQMRQYVDFSMTTLRKNLAHIQKEHDKYQAIYFLDHPPAVDDGKNDGDNSGGSDDATEAADTVPDTTEAL